MSTLKTVLISSALSALAFAGGANYTNNKINSALDEVVTHIMAQPKVSSLDAVGLTRELLDKGLSTQDVVTYMEKYINVHKAMNITLIDSKYIIAEPKTSKAMILTSEELDVLAAKYNVKASLSHEEIMAEYESNVYSK
ncbi:hypothetical protein [uncultured Pseudoalteromonas sp.]|uniref:hypothetical protein n=1 Tax=uncultured Pseudoalteromonas sp. TaxID=114053 RepID=UPI002592CBFF|nr:hypothetical protein [uncultured Pseudoalteromonas sp.]